MRITSIEIRVCQNTRAAMSDSEMRSGGKSTFDFLVITMKTDEGIDGCSFGFAGRGADMAGAIAARSLRSARRVRTFAAPPPPPLPFRADGLMVGGMDPG